MKPTDKAVKALKPTGKVYKSYDGQGPYIEVSKTGVKTWCLKYRYEGKENRLSFGNYPYIGVADARKKAYEAKQLLSNGINPKADRDQQTRQKQLDETLFKNVADAWYSKMIPQWAPATATKRKALLANDI